MILLILIIGVVVVAVVAVVAVEVVRVVVGVDKTIPAVKGSHLGYCMQANRIRFQ